MKLYRRVSKAIARGAFNRRVPRRRARALVNPGFGSLYGREWTPAFVNNDGIEVWMWRKGQRVRFFDADGNQVGPEQRNVGPAVLYALAQGWDDPTMPRWIHEMGVREIQGKLRPVARR